MSVRATVSGGAKAYDLSFNDIIGLDGKGGRGDAKKGHYQHRNGNILVVYSKNPQLVTIEPRRRRANGTVPKTNRTGLTRTGMFMVGKNGEVRLVTCDRNPDGEKNWRVFDGSLTIAGNPHIVPETQGGGAIQEDYDEEEDD